MQPLGLYCLPITLLGVSYHHIIIGFLINVQVQGQHPHQWVPFQIAGLLHAWQISHQISRYVDGGELPISAIPLCQLFPCHLGPPRPTLSINLYVKGCLDCTIGAFHMSIPSESPDKNGLMVNICTIYYRISRVERKTMVTQTYF